MTTKSISAIILAIVLAFTPVSSFYGGGNALAATETGAAKVNSGAAYNNKAAVKTSVATIVLSRKTVTLMKGKTITLKATVKPSSASMKAVKWTSSNPSVAAVNKSGKVTAKGKGSAIITCTAKDGSKKYAKCRINVKIPVGGIKLNKKSLTLLKGKTYKLKASVKPASASNKAVKWTSSNPSVATVNKYGKVTAKRKGTAIITCKAKDGSKVFARCRISVKAPATRSNESDSDSSGSGDHSGDSGNSYNGGSNHGSGETVWISATGSKYHSRNDCGRMNPSKATSMSREEAERSGYDACSICY